MLIIGGSADRSGLCVGDRVVEVNGINVEAMSHAEVVSQIRSDATQATLLVVDKITDNYLKKINRPVTSSLASYSSVHEIKISNTEHLAALRISGSIGKGDRNTDIKEEEDGAVSSAVEEAANEGNLGEIETNLLEAESSSPPYPATVIDSIPDDQSPPSPTFVDRPPPSPTMVYQSPPSPPAENDRSPPPMLDDHSPPPMLDDDEEPLPPNYAVHPNRVSSITSNNSNSSASEGRQEEVNLVRNGGSNGMHHMNTTTDITQTPPKHQQSRQKFDDTPPLRPTSDWVERPSSEWAAVKRNSAPSPRKPEHSKVDKKKLSDSFKMTPKRKEVKQTSADWKSKLNMFDNL